MKTRRKKQRGNILATTLLLLMIAATIYLSTSGLVMSGLKWSNHTENRDLAEVAAKSAVNQAIGRIRHDLGFQEDIVLEYSSEFGGAEAYLTFQADGGRPYSTNNSQGDRVVEGWSGEDALSQAQIYPRMAKLVAVGECRGSRYVAEALLIFPQFPYALASTGTINADGKVEVYGVESLASSSDGVTEEEKQAGHIVSNSPATDAVRLNAEVKVSGDVRAAGQIQANGAQVDGDIVPSAGETHIIDMAIERPSGLSSDEPGLFIKDYDPERPELMAENLTIVKTPAEVQASSGALEVKEVRYKITASGGPVELNNGVKLSDALLYVDGDVVIRGGIHGTGAIFATGKITVIGPSSLASDTAALVSGGGVELDGSSLGGSRFRGLVATLGDFTADNAIIEGAYIAAGTDPDTNLGTSRMTLTDVEVAQASDATKVNLDVHRELKIVTQEKQARDAAVKANSQIGLKVGGDFYTLTGDPSLSVAQQEAEVQASYAALKATPEQIESGAYPFSSGEVVVLDIDGNVVSSEGMSFSLRAARETVKVGWESYRDSVTSTSQPVDVVPILDVDLSKFTSGTSRTQIVYYIET